MRCALSPWACSASSRRKAHVTAVGRADLLLMSKLPILRGDVLTFKIIEWRDRGTMRLPRTVYLVIDNWNDYGFHTLFRAYILPSRGETVELGYVKIGQMGMRHGQPRLERAFTRLSSDFFSLGQDPAYYERLAKLPESMGREVLDGLNDLALKKDLWDAVKAEPVVVESLTREVQHATVEGQFSRLARGGSRLVEFTINSSWRNESNSVELTFLVKPKSHPPTNIHALIGRNGVGKSSLLFDIAETFTSDQQDAPAKDSSRNARSSLSGSALTNVVSDVPHFWLGISGRLGLVCERAGRDVE